MSMEWTKMRSNAGTITPNELQQRLGAFPPPALIDVRRHAAFDADRNVIPGAVKRAPEAIAECVRILEPWRPVVVYCVHGHEVSQTQLRRCRRLDSMRATSREVSKDGVSTALRPRPIRPRGGHGARPKIDRIACPWLIRRFIDPSADFFYVPNAEVRDFAAKNSATPYDIPDVTYTHVGPECSFDAFIRIHQLAHPALDALAGIVRGADTSSLHLATQASGLLSVSLGLSAMFADDHTMLKWGMLVYDSLYAWCREAQQETHGWYPEKLRIQEPA
jgi:hypothetical protein